MRLGVKVRSMGDGLTAPENGAVAAPGAFGFPVALGRQALRLLNSGRGGIVMLLVNLDADALAAELPAPRPRPSRNRQRGQAR
jgi:hypothetical protein